MGRGHSNKHVNTRFSPYQEIGAVSVASSSVATASTDISPTVATVAAAAASSSSSPFGAVHYSDSDSDESVGFYGPTHIPNMNVIILTRLVDWYTTGPGSQSTTVLSWS